MLHATNSQGKEVMKRHLWMEKKKSRIMVRNLKSKQQLKTKNYTMEEFISRIIDFMKSEYGDFLMIVMCLVFVAFIVMIFNKKTPE